MAADDGSDIYGAIQQSGLQTAFLPTSGNQSTMAFPATTIGASPTAFGGAPTPSPAVAPDAPAVINPPLTTNQVASQVTPSQNPTVGNIPASVLRTSTGAIPFGQLL